MKATELIEALKKIVEENGDRNVEVRGDMNGTFAKCSNVRMGKSPTTKDNICITGGFRE
jgi:hypothetical protein